MFDSLDHRFTKFLLESNALKVGDFTLKSGRQSPYFITAGAFDDGKKIATLGGFYAEKIQTEIDNEQLPIRIDPIFGPAYKGIPLAVATSIALELNYGVTVGYTFDRKEKKDHGDGGTMVGKPLEDGMTRPRSTTNSCRSASTRSSGRRTRAFRSPWPRRSRSNSTTA